MSDNVGRKKGYEALALALAAGQTLRDAAATAGVTEMTAYRRWKNPAFRQRVAELRLDMISQAVGKLADNMAESADVLRKLLAEDVKATVRLGAARANLELGVKLHESVELDARLAALERASKGAGGEHGSNPPPPTESAPTDEERTDNVSNDDGEPQRPIEPPGSEGG
jgi:hypothetical protein